MTRWKISDGFVFAAAGWLLSAVSILGAVGYLMGLASGGTETPDFVLSELWAVLLLGAVLSFYGSCLLHRWVVFIFPVASVIVVFVLLYTALPFLVCGQRICIPASSHP